MPGRWRASRFSARRISGSRAMSRPRAWSRPRPRTGSAASTRLGRTVTAAEIEARIRAALSERLRIRDPADLSLTLDPLEPVRLDPSVRGELAMERLELVGNRFVATLRIEDAPGFRLR